MTPTRALSIPDLNYDAERCCLTSGAGSPPHRPWILEEWEWLSGPEGLSKQKIRDLHAGHRREILQQHREFIDEEGPDLADHFADGKALDPAKIEPELIEVSAGSAEARLFRFATLLGPFRFPKDSGAVSGS